MGITPIERIRAWWAGLTTRDSLKCRWCKEQASTFLAPGGYRYCSTECQHSDAEAQEEAIF